MNKFIPNNHLDLGCGNLPRNPYNAKILYGLDIRKFNDTDNIKYVTANLSFEPIPFESDFFCSVSAFEFIEHVPRVLYDPNLKETFYPFMRLMNEVYRVLRQGGRFYAVTPCYPSEESFRDPTHVNYISSKTHYYFCGDDPIGRIYGFTGNFRMLTVQRGVLRNFYDPNRNLLFQKAAYIRRLLTNQLNYVKWEFEKY